MGQKCQNVLHAMGECNVKLTFAGRSGADDAACSVDGDGVVSCRFKILNYSEKLKNTF